MKIEIHTLRYGWSDWMAHCVPTLEAWCKRHNLPLKVTSSFDPSYPHPKFCQIDMIRSFLEGDSDYMMYVDADVVVNQNAPMPPLIEGWQMRPEQRAWDNPLWLEWCMDKFGERPPSSHPYCNAGIWICDRVAATQFLAVVEKPYHEGIMEQHHWNWWVMKAVSRGMKFSHLPRIWNSYPRDWRPAWMLHAYGREKPKWLKMISLLKLSKKIPSEKDA